MAGRLETSPFVNTEIGTDLRAICRCAEQNCTRSSYGINSKSLVFSESLFINRYRAQSNSYRLLAMPA